MSREYIQKTVESLIQKHQTRDPAEIAKALDIGIKYADIGSLKGLYTVVLDNRFIVVNQNLSAPQQRAVLAHELGHDRLHRHFIDNILQETMLYDMTSQPEYEANLFAAELLIDCAQAEQMAKDGATAEEIAINFAVENELIEILFRK